MHIPRIALLLLCVSLAACTRDASPPPASGDAQRFDRVPRLVFNQLAAELALPLFWRADANQNGALEPAELAVTRGLEPTPRAWLEGGAFTPAFLDAYAAISDRYGKGLAPSDDPREARRQALLREELTAARFTLVESDLRGLSAADRAFAGHILTAAAIVEGIYQQQVGSAALAAQLPAGDTMSRMVFWQNQGPWCSAPTTEKDPDCNALAARPPERSGLYPLALQEDEAFCQALAARPDAKALLNQFVAVEERDGKLVAVPYHQKYATAMKAVSDELRAAAAAFPAGEEAALKAYLTAAAQAFLDDSWFKADEAWAKMNAENSRWYLRIGPDETYFEPCAQKAGFHVSFALINPGSLKWQRKLEPVKNEMEKALAALAGPPYVARQVSFHLPDFIDIVLNAGDARSSRGATIGQSLPNWGPVANEGRGRTVVMTNFYTDPDSRAAWRSQVESLLCPSAMATVQDDLEPQLMSTVLHEAAHNLGPSHEYQVRGQTDDQVFGGPLASTMEELKAQTAALYLADWLARRGVIDERMVRTAHTYDITWAFGHISRGMYTGDGRPKAYSQLAAIQVGYLIDQGAITWQAAETAANGKDVGCFALALEKFPPAIEKLGAEVFGLKARGDRARAEQLKSTYVDAAGAFADLRAAIAERWLRTPQASFVYAVEL